MLLTGGWWPLYPAFFPPFFFFFLHLIITSPQHLHLITSTQQHPPQFSLIGFLQSEFIEWFPPSYESEGKPFLNISIIHCCEKKSHGKLESLPPCLCFFVLFFVSLNFSICPFVFFNVIWKKQNSRRHFAYPRFTWSYMRFYVEFGEISGNIPEY